MPGESVKNTKRLFQAHNLGFGSFFNFGTNLDLSGLTQLPCHQVLAKLQKMTRTAAADRHLKAVIFIWMKFIPLCCDKLMVTCVLPSNTAI